MRTFIDLCAVAGMGISGIKILAWGALKGFETLTERGRRQADIDFIVGREWKPIWPWFVVFAICAYNFK